MAERQSMNVSLTPDLGEFVRAQVDGGRFQTASEVVREALRLLEQAEQRRLVEKWVFGEISERELANIPADVRQKVRHHFEGLIEQGLADLADGRVVDGPTAMAALKKKLRGRKRS